jgi:hypothetical protein
VEFGEKKLGEAGRVRGAAGFSFYAKRQRHLATPKSRFHWTQDAGVHSLVFDAEKS